jgi:peptidoglycan hydrolase-like protein with peptidoglycan-binding domain
LAGIDAGLAMRATDRPQAIGGWRPILTQTAVPEADATVVYARAPATVRAAPAPEPVTSPAPTGPQRPRPATRHTGMWIAVAAVALLGLGGGAYGLMGSKPPPPSVAAASSPSSTDKAAQDGQAAAEAQRLKDQQELARLRAEAAAREKADQEAALRKQIEDETRQKLAAEAAEKQRLEEEARQKAEAEAAEKMRLEEEASQKAKAEAAARRKAEEGDRKAAEGAENALRLAPGDKQHVQVALTALGFNTNGTDGAFGPHTRDMIMAWQKARNQPPTGFLTSAQNQALLKEAAPAVSRFDDDQKKADEAKKKADDEKAKAEAAAKAAAAVPAIPAASGAAPAPAAPQQASVAPRAGPDGVWQGNLHCTPSRLGNEFSVNLFMTIANGSGTWQRGGTSETGTHSVTLTVSGSQVQVARVFTPNNRVGTTQTATMRAQFDGANTISGAGPEANGGGRNCDINMRRVR